LGGMLKNAWNSLNKNIKNVLQLLVFSRDKNKLHSTKNVGQKVFFSTMVHRDLNLNVGLKLSLKTLQVLNASPTVVQLKMALTCFTSEKITYSMTIQLFKAKDL
jgi:hypothetical protein